MNKFHDFFKKSLLYIKNFSTCARLQVSAILVKDGRIISTGYNGTASKDVECRERFQKIRGNWYFDGKKLTEAEFYQKHHEFSKANEIHAEMNCLGYALRNETNISGTTLYVSTSPCIQCSKLILVSQIKEIFYIDLYNRDPSGIEYLREHGISCRPLNISSDEISKKENAL